MLSRESTSIVASHPRYQQASTLTGTWMLDARHAEANAGCVIARITQDTTDARISVCCPWGLEQGATSSSCAWMNDREVVDMHNGGFGGKGRTGRPIQALSLRTARRSPYTLPGESGLGYGLYHDHHTHWQHKHARFPSPLGTGDPSCMLSRLVLEARPGPAHPPLHVPTYPYLWPGWLRTPGPPAGHL